MPACLFVSDLHGRIDRYEKLFEAVRRERPAGVFIGGDLFPHWGLTGDHDDFLEDVIAPGLRSVKGDLGPDYPSVFVILGNDDPRSEEAGMLRVQGEGLWLYAHGSRHEMGDFSVVGYSYVPPTPFMNKDWEKYDVSRFVPPGGVSPEEGFRSVEVELRIIRHSTIANDLEGLARDQDLTSSIFLFHTPPHDTPLDRVGNDGRMVDHVPLDLHVGSIAVRRFIEVRQPLLTLHGHVHESTRLTGSWRDRVGSTWMFSAAHDGPELCLVRFDPVDLESAERVLL
jgi:Icc-related predicted phosphoesterase